MRREGYHGAARRAAMILGRPIRVRDGVFQIRAVGARVTVLLGGGSVTLVDAGSIGSHLPISMGLGSLGSSLDDVERVVITHAHPDHCGGLGRMVGGRRMAVAAHRLDAGAVEAGVPALGGRGPVAAALRPALSRLMGVPVRVSERLEDGDVIGPGTGLRVVHVPGHTDGSIALHLPREGILIVGDALQYKFGLSLGPPARMVTRRPDLAMRSLERLLDLDFDTICFSHFPPMRSGAREALRALVARHLDRAARG